MGKGIGVGLEGQIRREARTDEEGLSEFIINEVEKGSQTE